MPTIRKETLLSHELDGDLVLYDPDLDLVHTLNTTARQVWECCDGVQTDEEIVEEISRRYDSPAGRVRADVHRTLAQLKRREFLRDSHEDGPIPGLGDSRRTFLKVGLKGVALLPYVAPLIETIALSDAEAQGTPINSNVPPGPPPSVSSCSPDNADKGDTLNVTVSGADFVPTPTADFGSGITINNVTFDTSSQLTVNITISVAATAGSRNVTITNPDAQSDTLVSGFTVNAAPPPTVTSCVPNNGNKNQTLNVTVNGSDFVATPTADFGAKIDVNSVTFVSSSVLTVSISIRHNAKSGSRDVTITNPDTQSDTLVAGFSVN